MTAEIAIMNREAIALASDSAVTSRTGTGHKIFTSANKLFALSQYHPVGVMVYGHASFLDAPWELVIKTYRKHLGGKEFGRIEEYVADLISFISNKNPLFPEDVQEKYYRGVVRAYFALMRNQIKEKIKVVIDRKGSITDREVRQTVSQVIGEHVSRFAKAERSPSMGASDNRLIIGKYNKVIDEERVKAFEKLPISNTNTKRLVRIAADVATKFVPQLAFEGITGVVVAGFGKDEYYPVLQSVLIEILVCDRLKYKISKTSKITSEDMASIVPFAQGEVVATFMEGMDPFLRDTEASYLAEVFKKCAERVSTEVTGLNNSQKANIKARLAAIGNEELANQRKKLDAFKEINYVAPVMRVVAMLPKDELAAMAEAFVNLTSFKRKVSLGPETVGGPIDVAVVSKGDGFIWIKRKHYFEQSLNPQFFARYHRG